MLELPAAGAVAVGRRADGRAAYFFRVVGFCGIAAVRAWFGGGVCGMFPFVVKDETQLQEITNTWGDGRRPASDARRSFGAVGSRGAVGRISVGYLLGFTAPGFARSADR